MSTLDPPLALEEKVIGRFLVPPNLAKNRCV